MATWSVPRNNADQKSNGGNIDGDTSFEAAKQQNGEVTILGAQSNSLLFFEGTEVTTIKTSVMGGYKWEVSANQFESGYQKAEGKEFVELECKGTNNTPIAKINNDNNFWLSAK